MTPARAADGVLLAEIVDATLRLARESTGAPGVEAAAETVARLATGLLRADRASVALLRDGFLETVATYAMPGPEVRSRLPLGYGVAGWTALTGEAAEVADVQADPRFAYLPYRVVRSLLTLPLVLDAEDLVGVLSVAAFRTDAFPAGSSQLLAPFADHAAIALRNAQTTSQLRAQLARYEQEARAGLADALHHLKNPLHNLGGFLTLLTSEHAGPLGERQRELLGTAQDEWNRLRRGIADLIEAVMRGDETLTIQPLAPADLLRDAADRARGQAAARGVMLVVTAGDALAPVAADAAALRHVLGNLLDNAIQHAPPGTTVRLMAQPAEDGMDAVQFAVEDQGPGLPAGAPGRSFERGGTGVKRADMKDAGISGTGLGLWLSRHLVTAQHGSIWADSAQTGTGARFVFTLPTWRGGPGEGF